MNKHYLAISLATLLSGSVALADQASAAEPAVAAYSELRSQLHIMTNIMRTAFSQNEGEVRRFADLNYSYLAGQGVVYRVRLPGVGFGGLNVPVPPVPPISKIRADIDIDLDSAEFESMIGEAMASAQTAIEGMRRSGLFDARMSDEQRQLREQIRELSDDARDLSWELREVSRQQRDLAFELRRASEQDKAARQAELDELQQQQQQLDQQLQANAEQIKALEQKNRQQTAELVKQHQQQQQQLLGSFEQTMGQVLCDYGVTLRSLPDDEQISVIVDGLRQPDSGDNYERVYIVSKSQLMNCQGRSDASDLFKQAQAYNF
ncbi:hypothetical protein [Idiomarina xiamenensis]|uniref:Uncharacterized protein n=1 Tax=Idiomarina xiamenensis 10-D-4 TaxID=740709 RepID=K2KY64_9GAMM|nr:hypothetical protein [Idiomarina xiamenensis]EKE87509.1 hypothetical protein A10D4_00395 [Idiomarina xiamenensis 10-D-4]